MELREGKSDKVLAFASDRREGLSVLGPYGQDMRQSCRKHLYCLHEDIYIVFKFYVTYGKYLSCHCTTLGAWVERPVHLRRRRGLVEMPSS